jgi:porin
MHGLGAVFGDVVAWRIVAFSACVLVGSPPTWANDGSNLEPSAPMQAQPWFSSAWKQITDPGGLRSRLEQAGVQFTLTYYGDALGNPLGGVQQGLSYSGRFSTIVDADLEKLVGWSGATFHASLHQIHGSGLSANNLENLMAVSGIEAPTSTRLFNLWIEQKLGSGTNLRLGQFTAAQEFLVSQNANLFVNSTFGWPALPAQNLPSGGPSYPEATPGARLKFTPNDQLTLLAAVFNGDPAGPGPGNPMERDPFGLAFRVNDPPLLITELTYTYNQDHPGASQENPHQEGSRARTSVRQSSAARSPDSGLPGTVKLGAWFHTGLFADQRFNAQGGLLGASSAKPLEHAGNFAVYGVIDQMLWRPASVDGDRGLNFFLRASAAPSDRNPINLYFDTGLTFKGPIASRPDDTVGIGFAFGRISPQAAASDRDLAMLTGTPMPIRDYEAAIELTYSVQLAQDWTLQPDLQYIIHPGGHVPNPLDPSGNSPIPNAAVIGMRTILKF